jgi:hypothetical protein
MVKQTCDIAKHRSSREISKPVELNNDLLELAPDVVGQSESTLNEARHSSDVEKVVVPLKRLDDEHMPTHGWMICVFLQSIAQWP